MVMDKKALLAKRDIGVEEVELPSLGGSVKVRGLSRREALNVGIGTEMDQELAERRLLALAMVDPALTEDEVGQWQDQAPAGELQPIQEAILRLSGISATAVKEAVKQFRR